MVTVAVHLFLGIDLRQVRRLSFKSTPITQGVHDKDKINWNLALLQDCAGGDILLGLCWDYPHAPSASSHGTSMSQQAVIKDIHSGPNSYIAYVEDMNAVEFEVDTNTNRVYVDSTSTWYQNHYTTEIASLHTWAQGHEERHYANVVEAEAVMDGLTTHPVDMYDACEGITGSVYNHDGIRTAIAGQLNTGINFIDTQSLTFDRQDRLHDINFTGSDYYHAFCSPGRQCCNPPACQCPSPTP